MAKGFKDKNPLDTISTHDQEVPAGEPVKTIAPDKPKGKVGRPRTKNVKESCKNINIAVPKELLNQWEEVKIVHGSNLTNYIVKLIEKDMDANYDKYKSLADTLNNI